MSAKPVTHPAVSVAVGDSVAALWTLGLSIFSGFVAAYIYAKCRGRANAP